MSLSNDIVDVIQKANQKKTSAYDSVGTVTRVEDGIAWVHIAGGVDETPVQMTINAKEGDQVQVRVAGGRAWLVGNASSPPTDDTTAKQALDYGKIASDAAQKAVQDSLTASEAAGRAQRTAEAVEGIARHAEEVAEGVEGIAQQASEDAEDAKESAGVAKTAADNAMLSLGNVQDVVGVLDWITNHGTMESQAGKTFDANNVYFVVDQNGDYVVGGTRYSLVTEPKAEDIDTYYCLSVDKSIQNYVATHIFVDNEGLWIIPDSSGNRILIATGGAGKTYETAGTYIIGKVNNVDTVFAKFLKNGTTMMSERGTQIAHLGYGEGKSASGTAYAPFFTFGTRKSNSVVGNYSVAEGNNVEASGYASHAEGEKTTASNYISHAEGEKTTASGYISHAEGYNTEASGYISHAEGSDTIASGYESHAEGEGTEASGYISHAEGSDTIASGTNSHAQNSNTVAGYDDQTAIGKYNDNQSNNAFEIGNGTGNNNRSNAFEVDWSGNTTASGDIEDGSGNVLANKLDSSGIFDLIYPVGSYYWTSNGSFSPANTFGGTWEKIDAGVTLVSAGTGYTVQSGTAKDGGEETVKLTDQQMAHGHGFTNPTVNKHHHDSLASAGFVNGTGLTMTSKRAYTAANTSGVGYVVSGSATAISTSATTADATATTSGGAVANLSGASSTRTAFDNMPPYKAAYCWHRTA